jgi:hypothetical protein
MDSSRTNKTQKSVLQLVENVQLVSKTKIFRFWAPFWIMTLFWILTPFWNSGSKCKKLKMFFRPVPNISHPKRVVKSSDRWRSSQFSSEKRPIDTILIFVDIFDFVAMIFIIKPLEE